MTEQKAVIRTIADREQFISHLLGLSLEKPIAVQWKNFSPVRSLSANAMYWVWMNTLSTQFNDREYKKTGSKPNNHRHKYDKDDMHNLCRHFLLGYETIQIRNTVIKGQLKSTAKLTKAEFCSYMEKLNAWAVAIDIFLPYPADSEYARFLEQNG